MVNIISSLANKMQALVVDDDPQVRRFATDQGKRGAIDCLVRAPTLFCQARSYLALKYVKSSCFSLFRRSTIDSGNIEGWATGRWAN